MMIQEEMFPVSELDAARAEYSKATQVFKETDRALVVATRALLDAGVRVEAALKEAKKKFEDDNATRIREVM